MTNCRPHRSRGRERGQVIALFVVLTVGFVAIAGLVEDGGRALSARARALDEAQAAARTAAQQVDLTALRAKGTIELDKAAASQAGYQYLASVGDKGSVTVAGNSVHVDVSISVPTQILGAFGVSTLTVSAQADAAAEAGGGANS
jgi:putative Flp pilus-assembly TadE/G-like protein